MRWIAGVAVAALLVACSDGGTDDDADVTDACDRLEELADALLSVHDATTATEVRAAVDDPLTAFAQAAGDAGDAKLEEHAQTARASFRTYTTGGGIDARAAQNEFDVALDRAGARCIELGATNDFPEEPTS